jgi:hypothetical protein
VERDPGVLPTAKPSDEIHRIRSWRESKIRLIVEKGNIVYSAELSGSFEQGPKVLDIVKDLMIDKNYTI